MHDEQTHAEGEANEPTVTQAELFDSLKRIGELEDQKKAIQDEIQQRTEALREALPKVASDSLLHGLLTNLLNPRKAAAASDDAKPARPAKKRASSRRK
ncbi:MAG: hypothetical protein R3E01_14150 [Pirellulaceae bacterium]|nr:hypothetical protein [Planctomycetales bacterium]